MLQRAKAPSIRSENFFLTRHREKPRLGENVSWSRSGAPALRCTICCRCLALDVVPQHEDVRFVAGVLVCRRRLDLEVVPQH